MKMNAYTEISGLEHVYLEDSYVLEVSASPGEVLFEGEFKLTPSHPKYRSPSSDERGCFVKGILRISLVRSLSWRGQGVPPATDAEGDIDFGHIDSFEWGRGKLALEGDWGDMTILADEVQVEFTIYDS